MGRGKTPTIDSSIELEEVMAAVMEETAEGFCVSCGSSQWGVEPDARAYKCEACGELTVYGAEDLLMMMAGST